MRNVHFAAVLLGWLVVRHEGAQGAPTTGPATRPAATRPVMVREAELPKGFPGPGPVGTVVVKSYPAYRAAVAKAEAGGGGELFGDLFEHITRNDIKMTAPVEMTYGPERRDSDEPRTMAFLYASTELGRPGADGKVRVVDLPAVTVVSIGVRGEYDAKNFVSAVKRLREFVKENEGKYEEAGPVRVMGYNSPMVPAFMRYSEVQVPVREKRVAGR